jgi:hypothetical protein
MTYPVSCEVFKTAHDRASWQNALAVFIAVAGVGAGAAIDFRRSS